MTPTDTPQGPTLEQIKSYIDELEKGNKSDPLAGMQAQPPAAPEPAEPPKFKVKLPDGREFEGTQDEVNAAYNDFAQRLSAAQAPQQPERRVTAEGPSYDPKEVSEEFARRLQKDPVEGMRYMNKYVFGVDDPGAVLRTMAQTITAQHQKIVGLEFRDNHPEWVPSPDNVAAMDDVMRRFNIPPTAEGLEAAYNAAKGMGRIKVKDATPEPANVVQMPQQPAQMVPPRVSRNQMTPEQFGEEEFKHKVNSMTADEIKRLNDDLIRRGIIPG